jgi:hypothetical protein
MTVAALMKSFMAASAETGFYGKQFRIKFNHDINAWLKSILPLSCPYAFACYYADGDLRGLPVISGLEQDDDAVDRPIKWWKPAVISRCGGYRFCAESSFKCYFFFSDAATPLGNCLQ